MVDLIIVGAGVAGMTAGIYAKRAGLSVLVFEARMFGGQIVNSEKVENYPGFMDISGRELTEKIYHQMNNLGGKIRDEEVVAVRKLGNGDFEVETDEGKYASHAIIIATGTKPRELPERQKKMAGKRPILYCATCDGVLHAGKTVVVVGSGNTAKHEVAYLQRICEKVYQIHHTDEIPADAEAIFVAVGRVPNTNLVRGLVELDENGYIEAEENCKTTCAGMFAAGDCRTKTARQLVTATGDGAVAAGEVISYINNEKISKEK